MNSSEGKSRVSVSFTSTPGAKPFLFVLFICLSSLITPESRAQIGWVTGYTKIGHNLNGGPALSYADDFGESTAAIGDLDTDGIPDLAVGAPFDDTGGNGRGALYVFFMQANGTARSSVKIASGLNGCPALADASFFGNGVAGLGDVDGDGIPDLAVGAPGDRTGGGPRRGALYVLFLQADGTVGTSLKIASGLNGGPTLADFDSFGTSVTTIGDLDRDGIRDLAVGTEADMSGAAYVLLMQANGTVKSSVKIASGLNGGPVLPIFNLFGISVASAGDLDLDGNPELIVGAPHGGSSSGGDAVYMLFMRADGTVRHYVEIASGLNGGPTLAINDFFGGSVAGIGDLDLDSVPDIGVGAEMDNTGGSLRGALYVLFMRPDGTVRETVKIASGSNGGPALADNSLFGASVNAVGDLNGDGTVDMAVGACHDDTGPSFGGAFYLLFLNGAPDALPDGYALRLGETLTITAPGVLANDTDPNGDSLTATLVSAATQGSIVLNPDGSFTYANTGTAIGTDSFTYRARDQNGAESDPVTVTLTINQGIPTITWIAPAPITHGTALSGVQLNAAASVPGVFNYLPATGTVLPAGSHTLNAVFTPADSANYAGASASVTLVVNRATSVISWNQPAAIGPRVPLSSAQLNATANVPGEFLYSPAAGTVLPVGSHTLSVTFTPTDSANYEGATASVTLVVSFAAADLAIPTLTDWGLLALMTSLTLVAVYTLRRLRLDGR